MTERSKQGCSVSRASFGAVGGELVEAFTLANAGGMTVTLLTFGAGIQSVLVLDRDGRLADVALGHSTLQPYLDQPQYMGSTVGRFANRIANGRFTLDGVTYQMPVNNGANALHGGERGFDKRNWAVLGTQAGEQASVTLGLSSADGDQGFPGALAVTATYRLDRDNTLTVEYRAVTDRSTIVNISNHAYWNLGGEGSEESALDHRLTIFADAFLPTDAGAIPTGEIRPVEGTPFDFLTPRRIGERVRDATDEQLRIGRGYDHNWVVARAPFAEARPVARVVEPASGRVMTVSSNQPGLQFYSGNFLDGSSSGKAGGLYRMGDAIALEPQLFPDTPNRPDFGSARLDPGETYRNVIAWTFSTE